MSAKPPFDVDRQLELVIEESRERRASQSRRLGAAESIAGIVVATAVVLVGLSVELGPSRWFLVGVAVLASAAVVLALAVLWPREVKELNHSYAREQILARPSVEARLWYIDQVMDLITLREALANTRFRLVRIALLLLIGCAVAMVVAAVVEGGVTNG